MLVPTVRTTCTNLEFCREIIEVWHEIYGEYPSKASIGVIVAQHDLETGSGNSCWNWNIANCKYVKSAGDVDYVALKGVWEIINGKRIELAQTDPGSWFRSFPTLKDGIIFYINFINSNRYKSAWSAVLSGNPAAFGHLLKISGFYTAPEAQYVSLINIYFDKFMKDPSFEEALNELYTEANVVEQKTSTDKEKQIVKIEPVKSVSFWQRILNWLAGKPF